MPKEKPILFSTPMIQAILAGRKTMTRRVMKHQDYLLSFIENKYCDHPSGFFDTGGNDWACCKSGCGIGPDGHSLFHAPYQVGDVIWVRETWKYFEKAVGKGESFRVKQFLAYKADGDNNDVQKSCEWYEGKWKPSIHMPRSAARIFLKVTNVRVERLQDITEEDARAEGFKGGCDSHGDGKFDDVSEHEWTAAEEFLSLWNGIYFDVDTNPWVWVIEFERVEA